MLQLVPLALALVALPDPPPDPLQVVAALERALTGAIEKAGPSVVAIARVRGESDETTAVKGRNPAPPRGEADGALVPFGQALSDVVALPGDYGSGVVVGPKGEILTAFHLLQGAQRIVVRAAGHQEFEAEVLAADPRSDLAVIVPREGPGIEPPRLRPIEVGQAEALRQGSFLLALGNPFNAARDGRASASWGILANTARRIERGPDDVSPFHQLRHQPTLLQLDAKLNLGMSGGAVIDLSGRLVGLTTTGGAANGYDLMAGYAIPLDAMGRRALGLLRQGKEVPYGFLGVSLDAQNSNRIGRVTEGTPAARGGVQEGDEILAVGDVEVPEYDGLSLALSAAPVGEPVTLKIRRGGKILETTVVMAKFPVQGEIIVTNRPAPWRGLRVDFTSVLAGRQMVALGDSALDAMARGGVAVVEVQPGSRAEAAGVQEGQVITAVDGRRVRTPEEFLKAVSGRDGPVTLTTELSETSGRDVVVK